jgi:ribosome-associated protein
VPTDPLDMALAAAAAASDKKGEDIVVLAVGDLLVVTEYFVIATGRTDRQVKTIAEEIEDRVKQDTGIDAIGREGVEEGRWVLLDFGGVVVHVFQPDEREFYRLEKLWSEAPRVALPEEITGPERASAAEGGAPASSGSATSDART